MDLIEILESPLTKHKITSNNVLDLAMGLSAIALCLQFVFEISLNGYVALFAVLSLPVSIITMIWGWNEYFPINYAMKGLISVSLKDISIHNLNYPITELYNLTFDINDFKGMRVKYPSVYPAGPCLSQGINNFIRFNFNGIEYSIQFLLRSETELNDLGRYLNQLYVHKIDFVETYGGGKSYGLKNLNYAEIQEYKKQR